MQEVEWTKGVSIHAPARGATQTINTDSFFVAVSIHAPARGATWFCVLSVSYSKQFQSTRPRGARQEAASCMLNVEIVSIHAPARGATISPTRQSSSSPRFNPRAREGRDIRTSRSLMTCGSFNPRAREGRDTNEEIIRENINVSIHAPARGATGMPDGRAFKVYVSIHAPARGATGEEKIILDKN